MSDCLGVSSPLLPPSQGYCWLGHVEWPTAAASAPRKRRASRLARSASSPRTSTHFQCIPLQPVHQRSHSHHFATVCGTTRLPEFARAGWRRRCHVTWIGERLQEHAEVWRNLSNSEFAAFPALRGLKGVVDVLLRKIREPPGQMCASSVPSPPTRLIIAESRRGRASSSPLALGCYGFGRR